MTLFIKGVVFINKISILIVIKLIKQNDFFICIKRAKMET